MVSSACTPLPNGRARRPVSILFVGLLLFSATGTFLQNKKRSRGDATGTFLQNKKARQALFRRRTCAGRGDEDFAAPKDSFAVVVSSSVADSSSVGSPGPASSEAEAVVSSNVDSSGVGPKSTTGSPEVVLTELNGGANSNVLSKVHILPLGVGQQVPDNILQFLGPTLKKFRSDKFSLCQGKIFEAGGLDFIVIETDPENNEQCVLGPNTEYFFLGPPIARLKRILFSALTWRREGILTIYRRREGILTIAGFDRSSLCPLRKGQRACFRISGKNGHFENFYHYFKGDAGSSPPSVRIVDRLMLPPPKKKTTVCVELPAIGNRTAGGLSMRNHFRTSASG